MAAFYFSQVIETLTAEGPIGCAEVARRAGTLRGGRPVHPSTITRAAKKGIKLPNGEVVRLEHYLHAGRIVTSWPAYLRFLVAQQPGVATDATSSARTPAERSRAAGRAEQALIDAGC